LYFYHNDFLDTKEDLILIFTDNNGEEITTIERELADYSSIFVFVAIIYIPNCMLNNILKPCEPTLYDGIENSLGIILFIFYILTKSILEIICDFA
jgi:hypothetical protein